MLFERQFFGFGGENKGIRSRDSVLLGGSVRGAR